MVDKEPITVIAAHEENKEQCINLGATLWQCLLVTMVVSVTRQKLQFQSNND